MRDHFFIALPVIPETTGKDKDPTDTINTPVQLCHIVSLTPFSGGVDVLLITGNRLKVRTTIEDINRRCMAYGILKVV